MQYMTLQEAADRLAVSRDTMARYVRNGLIHGYRVGPRSVRLRAADVEAFAHLVPSADDAPTAA